MAFATKLESDRHTTNPIERLNGKIKRRNDVVGIFPNEAAITRLAGATQRARITILEIICVASDYTTAVLPAVAARRGGPTCRGSLFPHHEMGQYQ